MISRQRPKTAGSMLLVLVLSLALWGCGSEEPSARAAPGVESKPPRAVRLAQATEGTLPRILIVTGTLAADEEVVTGFKVAGRVAEIAVDLGSPVRKGHLLARLDPTDFLLRVDQAEAALRQV